jgi:hypothetical protein
MVILGFIYYKFAYLPHGIATQFRAVRLPKAAKDCFEQQGQSRICSDYAESRKTTKRVKSKNTFCG